jgi:hypothetical protein
MKKQRGCWFQVSNFLIRVKIKKAELTVEFKNLRAISFYKKRRAQKIIQQLLNG